MRIRLFAILTLVSIGYCLSHCSLSYAAPNQPAPSCHAALPDNSENTDTASKENTFYGCCGEFSIKETNDSPILKSDVYTRHHLTVIKGLIIHDSLNLPNQQISIHEFVLLKSFLPNQYLRLAAPIHAPPFNA